MQTYTASFNKEFFDISSLSYKDFPNFIDAILWIKIAFAKNNAHYGFISELASKRICTACYQCIKNDKKQQNLPNIYAGSKYILCSSINELILNTDSEIELAELNCHQSANGIINTALELVVYNELQKIFIACETFKNSLHRQKEKFKDLYKLGRLGLKDHFPVPLSAQFECYLQGIERLQNEILLQQSLWENVCLGGDEIGLSLELPDQYLTDISQTLASLCGHELHHYDSYMDAIQNNDKLLITHAHIQALSHIVWKIARDLRLMCSGPRGGIQEITLPAVAPGSSIMPGKLNPVIAEMVFNTVDQVDANHSGLSLALKSSWLEGGSNSFVPIRCFINSSDLLGRTMICFAQLCIEGIEVNKQQCQKLTTKSLAVTLIIESLLGQSKTKDMLEQARKTNTSLESIFRDSKVLPEDICNELFNIDTLRKHQKLKVAIEKAQNYL